jgi:hypothetical protein
LSTPLKAKCIAGLSHSKIFIGEVIILHSLNQIDFNTSTAPTQGVLVSLRNSVDLGQPGDRLSLGRCVFIGLHLTRSLKLRGTLFRCQTCLAGRIPARRLHRLLHKALPADSTSST